MLKCCKRTAERRQRNRGVLLKLLRSVYFLVKNRIPRTTTYTQLVELQVANGDQLLEQHINQHPLNAQYTSRFSATMLIEAIDTWLERRLLQSLKSSQCFTIMADECQDISSQEELSICFRWLVNGCPEEHYLTTLYAKATDAEAITAEITSYMSEKNLEYKKLVGQGYDGAATGAECLKLPELKVVKPSDTRWLSHERYIHAIRKEASFSNNHSRQPL